MAGIEFSVPGCGRYFYDGCTNRILTLNDDASLPQELMSRELDGIMWRESLESLARGRERALRSLVLQLTRDCNLRCNYCAYSGSFNNMLPHANEHMSPETIRAAIDFFMEHSVDSESAVIIFYGGEPLLRFEQLRMAVDYADSFGRNLRFGISSNGLALGRSVLAWLERHPNVSITITVNGDRHDDCRKTRGGEGSLRTILSNLALARESYPRVWEDQLRLIANVASAQELRELREFYMKRVGKAPVMVTRIDFNGCDEAVSSLFTVDEARDRLAAAELRELYLGGEDAFLQAVYGEEMERIHSRGLCPEGYPGIIGSCMPLAWRLFVRADGSFNMCEKVSDSLCLGSLKDGFDTRRLEALYREMYEFAGRNCRGCWAQRLCMYCYQDVIDEKGNMRESFPPERCERSREAVLEALKLYIRMAKTCPERLEQAYTGKDAP